MNDIESQLEENICNWIAMQNWESNEDISEIISGTNSVFCECYCENVKLNKTNNREYRFTAIAEMKGEPRHDDVSFCGDKILVTVTGRIFYNADKEDWVIDDDYEVFAELEDWRDPEDLYGLEKEHYFNDADILLTTISKKFKNSWFRGHSNESWELKTTIARQTQTSLTLENIFMLEFKKQATFIDSKFSAMDPKSWLFLMQHHGLPTRLLDWTRNPLVALYFAVCNKKNSNDDACIWILDPSALNNFYKKPSILVDFSDYLPDNTNSKGNDNKGVFAIHSPYSSLRMKMQQSEFTIHPHFDAMDKNIQFYNCLKKLIINHKIKEELLDKLVALGIDRSFLFPDLDSIAFQIKENTIAE